MPAEVTQTSFDLAHYVLITLKYSVFWQQLKYGITWNLIMKSRLFFHFFKTIKIVFPIILSMFASGCVFAQAWTDMKIKGLDPISSDPKLIVNFKTGPFIIFNDISLKKNTRAIARFENDNWIHVGPQGVARASYGDSFALDAAGVPYVTYKNVINADQEKLFVMKLQNGDWVPVGIPIIMHNGGRTAISVGSTGTLYLAYDSYENDGKSKFSVVKLEKDSWIPVGPPIASGMIGGSSPSLALDFFGIPYISYMDTKIIAKLSVIKLENKTWISVGPFGFSSRRILSSSLALDSTGIPYVVYVSDDYRLSIMKYKEGDWIFVGGQNIAKTSKYAPCIILNSAGVPYVAYMYAGLGLPLVPGDLKFKMIKFDENSWVSVGPEEFSSKNTKSPS